jgi:hypothetical protein
LAFADTAPPDIHADLIAINIALKNQAVLYAVLWKQLCSSETSHFRPIGGIR